VRGVLSLIAEVENAENVVVHFIKYSFGCKGGASLEKMVCHIVRWYFAL